MKRAPTYKQGNLFNEAPDIVRNCSKCGRAIVVQIKITAGVRAEYCDFYGRCYDCAKAADFKPPGDGNGG
jgi:uncharacterized protein (DUF983 family)